MPEYFKAVATVCLVAEYFAFGLFLLSTYRDNRVVLGHRLWPYVLAWLVVPPAIVLMPVYLPPLLRF